MNINPELYRIFLAVAEKKSFTEAARELFLTQSAVSQAIKQLEAALGVQLFIRLARGAEPTEAGETLYTRIGGVFEELESAERYFNQMRRLEAGTLKIGAGDTLCRHMLLPALKEFHEKHPLVEIQVTNRTSGETAALVSAGKADIGFLNLPAEHTGRLDIEEISLARDCFICGEKYFDRFRSPVALAELQSYPVLMLEKISASRTRLDQYLKNEGVPLKPQIELGSLDLLIEFAANNLGIAAVIREFLGEAEKTGRIRVIPLQKEIPPKAIAMARKKNQPLSFAGSEFVRILREARSAV